MCVGVWQEETHATVLRSVPCALGKAKATPLVLKSKTFALMSVDADTKMLRFEPTATHMTSAVCPTKVCSDCCVNTSHSIQLLSPEEDSSISAEIKRAQDT